MIIKPNKNALQMLETEWIRKHVENHLVLGFCVEKFPFGILFIIIIVAPLLVSVSLQGQFIEQLWSNLDKLFFLLVGFYLLAFPRYHQAAIGWSIVKFTGFTLCFIMLIAGGLVGFFRNQPDAIHLTLLAILWFPGIEFIPRYTTKQKYITIGRLILTLPIAYLGYRTGNWHC